jgi:stage II sporulation protein D
VQGEIGSRFHAEAVKAQAVAVYTFIRYQNANGVVPNLPVAATAVDRIQSLTREVLGELIYHNGQIINSVFSASSAGWTSSARNVWGSDVVYLQSIRTDFDREHDPNMGRTANYTSREIRDAVARQTGIQLTGNPANWIRIINHVDTVYVGEMSVGGQTTFMNNNREVTITGRVFRERIMGFGIDGRLFRSASFTVEYDSASDSFTFTFNGYGHGVGMSQNGANILATHRGYNYKQILQHYYIGVEVR